MTASVREYIYIKTHYLRGYFVLQEAPIKSQRQSFFFLSVSVGCTLRQLLTLIADHSHEKRFVHDLAHHTRSK